MVYIGVEATTCSGIYSDGVKAGAATCVPHLLGVQMDFDVPLM